MTKHINYTSDRIINGDLNELDRIDEMLKPYPDKVDYNNINLAHVMLKEEQKRFQESTASFTGRQNPLKKMTTQSSSEQQPLRDQNNLQHSQSSANTTSMQQTIQNTQQYTQEAAAAAARVNVDKPNGVANQADRRYADAHHGYEKPLPETQAPVGNRLNSPQLKASDNLRGHLKKLERYGPKVYNDGAGNWTGGYGRKNNEIGDGWYPEMPVTRKYSEQMLSEDMAEAERTVKKLVGTLPLHQNEYDALVDLAFNVGATTLNETNSDGLHKAIKARNYAGKDGISSNLMYSKTDDQVNRGLRNRSNSRIDLFSNGVYGRRYE